MFGIEQLINKLETNLNAQLIELKEIKEVLLLINDAIREKKGL